MPLRWMLSSDETGMEGYQDLYPQILGKVRYLAFTISKDNLTCEDRWRMLSVHALRMSHMHITSSPAKTAHDDDGNRSPERWFS